MQLYSGTTRQFVEDTVQNRIAEKLQETFFAHFRHRTSASEVNSWRNSLRAMCNVVQYAKLEDQGLLLEYQLPLSSKRLDCMITGRGDQGAANAVIVELKQWSDAEESSVEGCVTSYVGGRLRDLLHPSLQVGQYMQYLADCHTAFVPGGVGLAACSYLHNIQFDTASELYHARHADVLDRFPLFSGDQTSELASFLNGRVHAGDGAAVLRDVLQSKYRASKKLLEHTSAMIDGQTEFVLLDEQLVVFNSVMGEARKGFTTDRRS